MCLVCGIQGSFLFRYLFISKAVVSKPSMHLSACNIISFPLKTVVMDTNKTFISVYCIESYISCAKLISDQICNRILMFCTSLK